MLLTRWNKFMHKNDVYVESGRYCDKAQKLIDLLYRDTHIEMGKYTPIYTKLVD